MLINGREFRWYDINLHRSTLSKRKIDLFLVDGPIGTAQRQARYPALDQLYKYLNRDFVIFLDDIHRRDEREIARRWATEFDLAYARSELKGGVGILRPPNSKQEFDFVDA